jgi:SulP family sulfate permease
MPVPAAPSADSAKPSFPWATAVRQTWRQGYRWGDLKSDLGAGAVVGIIALPLSMALAIACGAEPQHGLYTAIVAGALIALLGGARTNVSGPTAAFVVILAPITAKFGLAGLLIASLMAGLIQVFMGMMRLGRLIQYVPYPVTTGFTAGIAVVIATLQLKDLLGLHVEHMPEHYLERVAALASAWPSFHAADFGVGVVTLMALVLWPKTGSKVPAPLVALAIGGAGAWLVHWGFPTWFDVATINSRFSGIPNQLPPLAWPWSFPLSRPLNLNLLRQLLAPALAIAMLGAIESLLCAVVADGMTGSKHDPDAELVAQGIGNIVAPFFGGFAATAAIARTAASIRAGARSPLAAIVHALFVLLAMVALAPLLGYLPMASLAALLLLVAWRMSDAKHFLHIVRVAPRSDTVVLLTCFLLTVVFDMVISVTAGVMLAALLFMRRMADLASVKLTDGKHPQLVAPLPNHVRLYEIAGPLFFGAAAKAATQLAQSHGRAQAVILYLGGVPTMDVSGLVALETAVRKLQQAGAMIVLAGVQPQPASVMARAGLHSDPGKLSICRTLAEAEMLVRLAVPGGE